MSPLSQAGNPNMAHMRSASIRAQRKHDSRDSAPRFNTKRGYIGAGLPKVDHPGRQIVGRARQQPSIIRPDEVADRPSPPIPNHACAGKQRRFRLRPARPKGRENWAATAPLLKTLENRRCANLFQGPCSATKTQDRTQRVSRRVIEQRNIARATTTCGTR